MSKDVSYKISFHENNGKGWAFCDFSTTKSGVYSQMRSLLKRQIAGQVRNIEVFKMR